MPWSSKEVKRHSKAAAQCAKRRKTWTRVANTILRKGGSEGSAVRQANAAAGKAKC